MTQLLVSAIAFIVFRLRFLLRPTDELEILLNSTKLNSCHFLIAPLFQVCNYQPPSGNYWMQKCEDIVTGET